MENSKDTLTYMSQWVSLVHGNMPHITRQVEKGELQINEYAQLCEDAQ
jgi:hypothetical protein